MKSFIRILIFALILAIPVGALTLKPEHGTWLEQLGLPDQYNPWSRINLRGEIGMFTEYKLSHLYSDMQLCTGALNAAEVEYRLLPDKTANGCALEDRVVLDQSKYPYSAPVRPTCRMAAALVMWEENVVEPAAREHLGSGISRIDHMGIFNCRNIAGSSRRSQHASANAIDIGGFRLENGERVSVLNDWGKGTDKSRFLRAIRDGSCDIFRGVLGPDYNAAHANHFHLDMGRFNMCR